MHLGYHLSKHAAIWRLNAGIAHQCDSLNNEHWSWYGLNNNTLRLTTGAEKHMHIAKETVLPAALAIGMTKERSP